MVGGMVGLQRQIGRAEYLLLAERRLVILRTEGRRQAEEA
jgi:hypothetical protein